MMKFVYYILLLMAVGLGACTKTNNKIPDNPFFFEAAYSNSDTLKVEESVVGINGYGRGAIKDTSMHFEIQSTKYSLDQFKVEIRILKKFTTTPDSLEIANMFHLGNYTYGSSNITTLSDGVEISITDTVMQVVWSSSKGQQHDSEFEIIQHQPNFYDGKSPFITSGNFKCTLFNDQGDSLRIINALFSGRTVYYLP